MVQRRAGAGLRIGGVLVLLGLGCAAGGVPARAEDVFAVSGVHVDVTAETAAAARDAALQEGQNRAAQTLLRRLALRDDQGNLPPLADAQVQEFVEGIEVEKEKISTVRYIGDLTVHFKPEPVRRLLQAAGVRYAETASKPVLVLPLLRADGALKLFEEDNAWLAAWAQHKSRDGLVPLVVPLGDLSDIAAITAEEAAQGAPAKLEAIARRYGAGDSLAAIAVPSGGPPPTALDVSATRFGPAGQESTDVFRTEAAPGEASEALYARAVAELQARIEDAWKRENQLRFDREETLRVAVPIDTLEQWAELRRRLAAVVLVRNAEIDEMSKSQAALRLRYIGDLAQLRSALAQKDLHLEGSGSEWTLRLRGAPAPSAGGAVPADGPPPDRGGRPGPGVGPAEKGAAGAPAAEPPPEDMRR